MYLLYFIKVILISVWMELVRSFVRFHAMMVLLLTVCFVSYSLLLHLSSFSHARLCLVMLEICLFHAEPVHTNIIQYCVTYMASYIHKIQPYWTLHILFSLSLSVSCAFLYWFYLKADESRTASENSLLLFIWVSLSLSLYVWCAYTQYHLKWNFGPVKNDDRNFAISFIFLFSFIFARLFVCFIFFSPYTWWWLL